MFRQNYKNTHAEVTKQLLERAPILEKVVDLSKKINAIANSNKTNEIKEKLSNEVLLDLAKSIPNLFEQKEFNELEKAAAIHLIRENLVLANADLQEKIEKNSKPKNEYLNIASLQEKLNDFQIKFGKDSVSTFIETLSDSEKKLIEKIQQTGQKGLFRFLYLEHQGKAIEVTATESKLNYYRYLLNDEDTTTENNQMDLDGKGITRESEKELSCQADSMKEELKLYENLMNTYNNPSKKTDMQKNSSFLKKDDRPKLINDNSNDPKASHISEVLSSSGSRI
ncbi:MAG: hypothetical protein LEGION0398_MBIBDBAK_00679 [Legionellaceae bacterium]